MFPIFNIEKGYADLVLDFKRDAQRGHQDAARRRQPNTVPSRAEIPWRADRTLWHKVYPRTVPHPKTAITPLSKLCAALAAAGKEFDFVSFVNRFFQNGGRAKALNIDDEVDTLDGEYIGVTHGYPPIVTPTRKASNDR